MVIPRTDVLVFSLSMVFTNVLQALSKKETMSLTPYQLALEFYLRQENDRSPSMEAPVLLI